MSKSKKLLAVALVGTMVFSNVPSTVYAIDDTSNQESQLVKEDNQQENTQQIKEETTTTQSEDETNSAVQNETKDTVNAVVTQSQNNVKAAQATTTLEIKGTSISKKDLRNHIKNNLNGNTGNKFRYSTDQTNWKEVDTDILLNNTNFTLTNGTYYVQENKKIGGTLFKPVYGWVDLGTLTVRNYYNVTFTVTGNAAGEVTVDNQVATTAKAYTDQESLKFKVKDIDGYTVTVKCGEILLTPNTNGEYVLATDTLADNPTVSVQYEKASGVKVDVTQPKNGTIKIGDIEGSTKVEANQPYTITVTPKDGYAVENVTVNGQKVDVTYDKNHVAKAEVMVGDDNSTDTVTATLVKVQIKTKSNDINYYEGMSVEKIKENVFKLIDLEDSIPSNMTLDDLDIQYNAGGTFDKWQDLDFDPGLNPFKHKFGKNSKETIKITYKGNHQYPSVSEELEIELKDLRKETTLTINDGIMLKYKTAEEMDQEIRILIANNAVVTDQARNVIKTTKDDFSYTPSTDKWNAGEQTITVTYKGNGDYKTSHAETTIKIVKGDAKVIVNSQKIIYGEKFDTVFSSDPKDAKVIGMIVGIDGNGKSYVALDLSALTADNALANAIYNALKDQKVNVGTLVDILSKIPAIDGGILDSIQQVIDVIKKVYPNIDSLTINLKLPTEAGVYMAVGATTNQNYKTAVGVGYLTIAPQTQNIKLKFKNSLPTDNKLSHKDAQTFEFGGKVIDSNSQEVSANLKTLYYGFNNSGKFITSKTPITEPGQYVETVATIGGNYQVAPIVRSYKVDKEVVTIKFDDAPADNVYTVEYDGQQHAVTAGVYDENDVRIADASIKYMHDKYNSIVAPVNAKTYQVMASYAGNKQYKNAVVHSRLVITQKQVTITADNQEITYGDGLPEFTYTVTDKDRNKLSEEEIAKLGTIKVVKEDSSMDVGEYDLTVEVKEANANYSYELATGKLTIKQKQVTITADNQEITYGDKLPELTYTVTDKDGSKLSEEEIAKLGTIKVVKKDSSMNAREYDLTVEVKEANANYSYELAIGKLTIKQKQVTITADNQEITYGDKLPELTYTVTDKDGSKLSEEEIAKLGTIKVVKKDSSMNAGEYELTVETADANDNYVYELAPGILTISKRKLNVEIDSKKKVVGEKDPKLTYTLTKGNLVDGDDLGLTLTRESGEKVGLYDIYAHVEDLNNNYEVEISDGKDKFEIVDKAVVVDTNKTNTSDKTHKKGKPSTGDDTQIMSYVVSMMVTLFAIAVMVFLKREYLKK